jgi:hypothetical protein
MPRRRTTKEERDFARDLDLADSRARVRRIKLAMASSFPGS